jgi:hypothetical protein
MATLRHRGRVAEETAALQQLRERYRRAALEFEGEIVPSLLLAALDATRAEQAFEWAVATGERLPSLDHARWMALQALRADRERARAARRVVDARAAAYERKPMPYTRPCPSRLLASAEAWARYLVRRFMPKKFAHEREWQEARRILCDDGRMDEIIALAAGEGLGVLSRAERYAFALAVAIQRDRTRREQEIAEFAAPIVPPPRRTKREARAS